MSEEKNFDKPTKKLCDISDIIGWILLVFGIANYIGYLVWVFLEPASDKWFTRQFLSLMCFGFAGIIFRLRK